MKIHYVMPMAGRGSRFKNKGFDYPKPLIDINGKPFFYWSAQSVMKFLDVESLDFVILKEHADHYSLDRVIQEYYPNACVHIIPEVTEGAVITCMKGIEAINDDLPIVFNDCDHMFKSDAFNSFCRSGCDENVYGALLTFFADEPKYSFVGKDSQGNIVRTAEKQVISNEAICGCYYFKSKKVFLDAAEVYLKHCHYSEYFMSGVYNILINEEYAVKSMPTNYHIPFGTPEEYEIAKTSGRFEELE